MDSVKFVSTALAMLSWLAIASAAARKSRICSIGNWPKCAQQSVNITATGDYAITPSSYTFSENESISLKIHSTSCPTANTRGFTWYKIEAIANGSNIGSFLEPEEHRGLADHSCRNHTTIVFQTCEAHPFVDLPRQYRWTAPDSVENTICFRLTLFSAGDCSYTETCISARNATNSEKRQSDSYAYGEGCTDPENCTQLQHKPSNNDSQPISENIYYSGINTTSNPEIVSMCLKRWNCTNAKRRAFCGSDGKMYTSRCQIRLNECITNSEITIRHAGNCKVCEEYRTFLRNVWGDMEPQWLPTCDCDGYFKKVQCDGDRDNPGQLECWCSYHNSGSEVLGTRRKIVDVCTDPATFEFNCNLL